MNFKRYEGDFRRELSFPLGGIGAGCVGLDGYGRLIDWEIFNRPNKRSVNGYSHFAVKAEQNGRVLDARVLNADALPSYMGEDYADCMAVLNHPDQRPNGNNYGFGPKRELMGGLPHFENGVFEARYPFARLTFGDSHFPAKAELNAFSPFIPLDADSSGHPAAFFTISLENNQTDVIEYTVAFSVTNPLTGLHKNLPFHENGLTGIVLTDNNKNASSPAFGQLAFATDAADTAVQSYWFRGSWFDDLSLFWHDFTQPGMIHPREYDASDSWSGIWGARRDTATLEARFTLAPGEKKSVRFVLGWYFPTCINYWNPVRDEETCPRSWKNAYASAFDSAKSVVRQALVRWDELERRTRLFAETLYASDLPEEALDAVGSTVSHLISPTCLRLENGEFYAFEGCNMTSGSCEGSCTHVWNYAFALPFLFPSLERSMRELDYRWNQHEDGGMEFRLKLPLGRDRGLFRSCVDGLMGGVIKFYRDWKICGDDDWLKKWWPSVKKSLAYAWSPENPDRWDPCKTGVITGRQHHTLDMELFGPNAWLNNFYLAALKAASEIADYLGETEDAAEYLSLWRKGRDYTENELFNGEYFIQKIDLTDRSLLAPFTEKSMTGGSADESYWNNETKQIKYQIQNGCGIDQVLAVWMGERSGLHDILDEKKVKRALQAIYRNNFKPLLREHANPCRVYGLNDESGTVICEWPEGVEKPVVPVPYSEETMHGFEYQAASHMIAHGLEEEGLRMVKAVRDRYDGRRRNPWNEMECGSNYARSMASYALLLIYSGFEYDLPRHRMGFKPLRKEGRFFWSLEGAWGEVLIGSDNAVLTVLEGVLTLNALTLPFGCSKAAVNDAEIACTSDENGLRFASALTLKAGQALKCTKK